MRGIILSVEAAIFDTHSYVKKLQKTGVPGKQAEVHAEILAQLLNESLVTKETLEIKLRELEYRLTIKLGTMMVAAIGIFGIIVKLIK